MLPRHALRTLLRSLDRTGSDFATGNVHRFNRGGVVAGAVPRQGVQPRRGPTTHITKFRGLLVDRIAPNKLFRRSFWDQHGFAFPEGVTHEDIPVILPAHFLAKSVDVISEPVYLYRLRETGGLSITQRRLEPKVLLDRLAAVSHVSTFLRKHKPPRQALVRRRASSPRTCATTSTSSRTPTRTTGRCSSTASTRSSTRSIRKAFEPLPAIERLKWRAGPPRG